MQFFHLATLTAFTDDGWWLPPPPVATGTPCPGGAEFRYVQKWPSGFKAVVQFKGEWVPGRVVVAAFDSPSLPVIHRAPGAALLGTSYSPPTATWKLGATPGVLEMCVDIGVHV